MGACFRLTQFRLTDMGACFKLCIIYNFRLTDCVLHVSDSQILYDMFQTLRCCTIHFKFTDSVLHVSDAVPYTLTS